jgi:hypothetical protein
MDIQQISRSLNKSEISILKKRKNAIEKEIQKGYKPRFFLCALLIGVIANLIAYFIKVDFLTFVFGTIAVIAYACIIFLPYEIYKDLKKAKKNIAIINNFLEKNEIKVMPINALRIARAKEYEDEGDLFIIEYEKDKVLYYWHIADFQTPKNFPCLSFEVYEKAFANLTWRTINPLNKKVVPLEIDKKDKWIYMSKIGAHGHLETENINFDDLIKTYQNIQKH